MSLLRISKYLSEAIKCRGDKECKMKAWKKTGQLYSRKAIKRGIAGGKLMKPGQASAAMPGAA